MKCEYFQIFSRMITPTSLGLLFIGISAFVFLSELENHIYACNYWWTFGGSSCYQSFEDKHYYWYFAGLLVGGYLLSKGAVDNEKSWALFLSGIFLIVFLSAYVDYQVAQDTKFCPTTSEYEFQDCVQGLKNQYNTAHLTLIVNRTLGTLMVLLGFLVFTRLHGTKKTDKEPINESK